MGKEKTSGPDIDWDMYSAFVQEFREESDRAAVVLGAAKLDLVMYQVIRAFLVPCPSSKDELLDGDSPLGTFSAKINVMHRLGLIDAGFARALHLVRRIRNSFAHEVSGVSLKSGAHSDRVKEMVQPYKDGAFYAEFRKHFFDGGSGPAIDFRIMLAIMVGRLEVLLCNTEVLSNKKGMPIMHDGMNAAAAVEQDASNKQLQPTA